MTDVDSSDPAFANDAEIRQGIELLFFAYREFTVEADAILAEYGLGRAHHRVLHFVGRHPRMPVGELLGILRITKQSLSRVLRRLVRQGFIVQRPGAEDRRQRLLELTAKGRELEKQVSSPQRARIAAAYREAGAPAVEGFRRVLFAVIADTADRHRVEPGPSVAR
jgi:DNA-binding MarR family transcriptional regulator